MTQSALSRQSTVQARTQRTVLTVVWATRVGCAGEGGGLASRASDLLTQQDLQRSSHHCSNQTPRREAFPLTVQYTDSKITVGLDSTGWNF